MKNILIVCHDSTLSGANMALLDWIKNEDNKSYNFFFLLPKHNLEFEELIKKSGFKIFIGNYTVPVKHLGKVDIKVRIKDIIKFLYSKTINRLILMTLKKKLKKYNINIVHSNSFAILFGAELAIKLKVHHIWHIREFMEDDHQITHYNHNKVKKLCEKSNAIFISDAIKEKYNNINFINSIVIYDNVQYDNNYKKQRKFLENNTCNLIIAGSITENKGQREAIDATNIVNNKGYNVTLYICGKGEKENELKEYVKQNKMINIKFLGHQKQLNDIRKNIDIALMCSNKEALGRVTIEGMYYENLVIGANSGCTPFIIKHKINGLLYNKGDAKDLANKIIYAIKNINATTKMIENAKKYAIGNFSGDIYYKIVEFYDRIII